MPDREYYVKLKVEDDVADDRDQMYIMMKLMMRWPGLSKGQENYPKGKLP